MIYLDSCIVIYALEDPSPVGQRARAALRSADGPFAISPLVVHESLVLPFRRRDTALIERYTTTFVGYAMIELDSSCYLHAAELRAETPGLKTVDALHLAAAQLSGCEALWTNDKRLAAVSGGFAVDVINS